MPSKCFIPGCLTGYLDSDKNLEDLGLRNPNMFSAPKDAELLEKWRTAIGKTNKELSSKDHICELHFKEEEIERSFHSVLDDGNVFFLNRIKPTLKDGAIPSASSRRLSSPKQKNAQKRKTTGDETQSPRMKNRLRGARKKPFDFEVLLGGLDSMKMPNTWWTTNVVTDYVIFACWDVHYLTPRKVAIHVNLEVKIFLKDVKVTLQHAKISSVESLVELLCEVNKLVICENIQSRSNGKGGTCIGYVEKPANPETSLCFKCRNAGKGPKTSVTFERKGRSAKGKN